MAVAATALAAGIERDAVAEGLRTFAGVPHRLERVGERDGVRYVNDSKATNVAAAAAALRSFDGGVRAILGGSLKGGGFAELVPAVAERCRACYLIGEAEPRLATDLAPAGRRAGPLRRPRDRGRPRRGGRRAGRDRAARARLRQLRRLPRLRGAGRPLPRARRRPRRGSDERHRRHPPRRLRSHRARRKRAAARKKARPVEYSLLLTATMCLVAFGVVMVFSASSSASLLGESGDGAYYLKRTLMFGAIGLVALRLLSIPGMLATVRRLTPALLGDRGRAAPADERASATTANGAQRWIALGPVQIQASEIAKIALLLYGASILAERPKMTRDLRGMAPVPARRRRLLLADRRRARPRHGDGHRLLGRPRC